MEHWAKIIEALSAGEVAGAHRGAFERYETHGSVVLVSGEVAYKVKKQVAFDVFDYSTVERRGEMCRREVELNSRLAPDVYVSANPIYATPEGYVLGDGSEAQAEPVEWVVVMARISPDDLLFRKVDTRRATPADLDRVGRRLGRFHFEATPVDPSLGGSEALRAQIDARVEFISRFPDEDLDTAGLDSARRFAFAWLDLNESRLSERAEQGWVRDGHGDLRLEHVVLLDDSVQVIDCVEFDATLRAADVLNDLSFLAMELQLGDREDLTQALIGAWEKEGCPLEEDLLWFFAALKALVRVEVGLQRASQLEPGYRRELVMEMARSHLALAQHLFWRAHGSFAIVVSGLSGSGKTSISTRLASQWGFARLASDEIRKQLIGVDRDELAPRHAYESYVSEAVYENLGRFAADEIMGGRTVVVDATFRRPEDQARFIDAMRSQGSAPLATFELQAHEDVLRARVTDRTDHGGSDADISVLEAQLSAHPGKPLLSDAIPIDTSAPVDSVLAEIELHLLAGLPRPAEDGHAT